MKALNPAAWPRPKGYSNGIEAQGRMVFVAGMIGWDVEGRFETGLVAQFRKTLENTLAVLAEAGAGPANIVRMTWFIKDLQDYRENLGAIGAAYREVLGKSFPAMAVVGINDLVETEALIEIETTAVVEASE
ncbi:MAG TPA: RidA family protein [Woeseiaceae bacterium]|nr:RidA family protein [Woeseiaceae bacterium]